jgi:hypothetical protein
MKKNLYLKISTTLFIFSITFSGVNAQVNLQWAKQFKGSNNEVGTSVAVDASGNVYTVGYFDGTTDFDPGTATNSLTTAGWDDVFVTKLDASGNFVWAKQFKGTNDDYGQSIGVDASGNVYVTGYFTSTVDFDPGTGVTNLTSAGNEDIFIVKLTSAGALSWAKQVGSTLKDNAYSLKVDGSANVILTGTFAGTVDFDPGTATSYLSSVGAQDIFILKLNSAGTFVWAKNIGSMTSDCGFGVAVDATGNVYCTGSFTGIADFNPGTTTSNLTPVGSKDVFVLKWDASGNYVWAINFGGTNDDEGYSIAVDGSGNVSTTGYFNGTVDFDPGTGTSNLTSQGYDVFVSKLSSTGAYVWAQKMGGSSADYGKSITVDASGNVFTTGYFNGTADFDPGTGTSNLISAGSADIFISKLTSSGSFSFAKKFGSTSSDQGYSIALNTSNNIFMTGFFSNTVDFDPGTSTVNLISGGLYDTYILRLDMSTGIDDISNNSNFKVYPNPTSGKFNIETDNGILNSVEIFNVVGNKVFSKYSIRNDATEVDISNFSNGIYFVNITTANSSLTTKMILQK